MHTCNPSTQMGEEYGFEASAYYSASSCSGLVVVLKKPAIVTGWILQWLNICLIDLCL